MKTFPLFVVYRDLLSYSSAGHEFKPNRWRTSVAHVQKDKRLWQKETPTTEDAEDTSGSFMMVLMGRVMYGMMMGFNQPDPLDKVPVDVEVLHLNEPATK